MTSSLNVASLSPTPSLTLVLLTHFILSHSGLLPHHILAHPAILAIVQCTHTEGGRQGLSGMLWSTSPTVMTPPLPPLWWPCSDLDRNSLTGPIPPELGNLKSCTGM